MLKLRRWEYSLEYSFSKIIDKIKMIWHAGSIAIEREIYVENNRWGPPVIER